MTSSWWICYSWHDMYMKLWKSSYDDMHWQQGKCYMIHIYIYICKFDVKILWFLNIQSTQMVEIRRIRISYYLGTSGCGFDLVIPEYFGFSTRFLDRLTSIPAWISNCIHYKVWDKNIYPCTNFTVQPLKFGNRLVIPYHTFPCLWLFIHAGFKVNPYM